MQNESHIKTEPGYPKASTFPPPGANGQAFGSTPSAIAKADDNGTGVPREVHSFLADIEHLITATTSLTGQDLADAKAKLSARVIAAKKSVEDMSSEIVGRARNSAVVTNKYVHEQPWNAVGIGAVAGFVLGVFLARRN